MMEYLLSPPSTAPVNLVAKKIISRNFRILREDSMTSNILNKPPLKTFRNAKNLKDLLVSSSLPRNVPHQSPGHHPQLQHPRSLLTSWDIFPASRNTRFIAWRAPNVHQQRTLGRPEATCQTAFENTAEMSSTGGMTFLYLPTFTKQIIHWRT